MRVSHVQSDEPSSHEDAVLPKSDLQLAFAVGDERDTVENSRQDNVEVFHGHDPTLFVSELSLFSQPAGLAGGQCVT